MARKNHTKPKDARIARARRLARRARGKGIAPRIAEALEAERPPVLDLVTREGKAFNRAFRKSLDRSKGILNSSLTAAAQQVLLNKEDPEAVAIAMAGMNEMERAFAIAEAERNHDG